MNRKTQHLLLAGFAASLALLAGVAWLGGRQTERMGETAKWVARTHKVQAQRNRLLLLVLEIESNQRSYALTGLPVFFEQFEGALPRLAQDEQKLEELTHDDRQKTSMAALQSLIAERIAYGRDVAELRKSAGAEAAAQEVATLKGKKLTNEIRAQFTLMDERGTELLTERSAAALAAARKVMLLTATGTCLSMVLLITVFAVLLRENRLRCLAESETDRFLHCHWTCSASPARMVGQTHQPRIHAIAGLRTPDLAWF